MRPILFSVIILFLLTACVAGAPTSQTSEVSSEAQVTVTLTFTATPTVTFTPAPAFSPEVEAGDAAPAAEFDLSTIGGMKDLGDAWQFADPASNKYITIAKSAVKVEGDWAIMGLWNVNTKTGEVVSTTGSAAPRSVEEIGGFRTFTIVEGSPNEAEMWKAVHLAINESIRKTDDFDPKSIFVGAVVKNADGTERTIALEDVAKDLDPSHWYDIDNEQGGAQYIVYEPEPRNHEDHFHDKGGKSWFQRNPQANPLQIVLDRGYFAVDFIDKNGIVINLLAIPVAAYDGGNQVTGGLALVKREYATDVLGKLNIADRASLVPALAYGDKLSVDPDRIERILLSDPELRTKMVEWNRKFFENTPNTGTYNVYPQAISEMGVFDLLK